MKQRLDVALVERGLASSRTKAQALIMAGQVKSGDRVLDKPGQLIAADAELTVVESPRYVSRGGDKLESVAAKLDLDFQGKTVLDAGASTGGFTDFALQNGAAKVYSVDVGTNQLDYKLRQDPRVAAMEQTDIRELEELPEPVDIIVMDLAFISLTKVLDGIDRFLRPGGEIVTMAKPQFEAGKALADRYKGVIPEPERTQVLADFERWLAERFEILGAADSKVAGPAGNVERFYLLKPKR